MFNIRILRSRRFVPAATLQKQDQLRNQDQPVDLKTKKICFCIKYVCEGQWSPKLYFGPD